MKPNRRLLASLAALAAVIVLAAWYFTRHAREFGKILDIDLQSFVLLSLLCILAIWLSGLQIQAIVGIFRTRISAWEAFGLSAMNTMANFYLTKAGLAAKGVYLKRRHQFPYAHFVSAIGGTYVITLLTQGIMGVVFALAVMRRGGGGIELFMAFLAVTVGGILPFLMPRVRLGGRNFFLDRVQRVLDGWEQVKRRGWILVFLALLNMAYVVVGALRLYVSYHGLGYDVGYLPCLALSPISTLTVILSVTPGAVGIRQALVGYGSKVLDVGLTEGVVASTVDHAVGTIWVFIFGAIFANWIWAARKAPSDTLEEGR